MIQSSDLKKPMLGKVSTKDVLKALDPTIKESNLKVLEDAKLETSLITLDELTMSFKYKFGVILVKEIQRQDDDYLRNGTSPILHE